MNSSTLAVLVSFHPAEDIIRNVHKTLEQVSKVIVVDNESSKESREILSRLNNDRVDIIYNEMNLGVAAGFNQGVRWGQANGYLWFLLLDQDSCPTDGMVDELLKVANNQGDRGVVMVGPHHEDFVSKWPPRNPFPIVNVSFAITSGFLLNS